MIVRKIKPQEWERIQQLSAISFEYGLPTGKPLPERLEEAKANPSTRLEAHWQSQWAAFEDDDQSMMSCLAVIPYPIHFDGHHCSMTGIGNVVTLPPYRRRGGIRACFEAALPEMYKEDVVFSYLYPFSTAYYRKFGYDLGCERTRYKLRMSMLPSWKVSGTLHLLEPGTALEEDIRRVYETWQEAYNLMVVGGDFEFAWTKKANPSVDQEYTYVYKALDGTPKAYTTFRKVDRADGRNLEASRFVFTDRDSFEGLISLFASLAADHRFVSFYLPQSLAIAPLLPEWSMGGGEREVEFYGMVRVVHAQKALSLARTRGTGSLVLDIRDAQIPQNNGRFLVRFQEDRVLQVEPTQEAPHLSLGIGELSRLLTGCCDVQDIPLFTNTEVHAPLEQLAPLFHRKKMYIDEYF